MLTIPPALSPVNTNSFAYFTFKDRLPVIITRVVDHIYRNKNIVLQNYGNDKIECIKYITSELSRLRHELSTNKAITLFTGAACGDEEWWNKAIIDEQRRLVECGQSDDGEVHWFKTTFLFGENYMYRRIVDIVLKSGIPTFDPFHFEKEPVLYHSIPKIHLLTLYLRKISSSLPFCNKSLLEEYFETFMKMSLWGNEADLSLSVGEDDSKLKNEEPKLIVKNNNCKLLIDDYKAVFEYLYDRRLTKKETTTVTIVLDNGGSELLADLHFVEFLLLSRLATKVVLVVKSLPWYVSDVTLADIEHTLTILAQSDNNADCHWLSETIESRLSDSTVTVISHLFFTLPHPYCAMETMFPQLYRDSFSPSSLIVLKGDLNYRKLVSDLCWPPLSSKVSFSHSLLGFHPAPLVALRVLKCDVQVGLSSEAYSRAVTDTETLGDDWMTTSRFGVVQSCDIPLLSD